MSVSWRRLLPWFAIIASTLPVLHGRDQVAADAIWQAAIDTAGEDYGSSIYVDAARVNTAVLPWQTGWSEARARVIAVGAARRRLLLHDRGGRRHGTPTSE